MSTDELKNILVDQFNIITTGIKPLVGYETLNFKVKTDNKSLIVKVYEYDVKILAEIKGESIFQRQLIDLECEYPLPIPTTFGDDYFIHNNRFIVRCLTFLEGTFLADVDHSDNLITSFGKTIAQLNHKTKGLFIPSIQAKRIGWDLSNTHWSRDNLKYIIDDQKKSIIDYFLLQFNIQVLPKNHHLPQQIIHNDANDWNVLCKEDLISGIIDFGDAVYSTRISDIAIALSYLIVAKDDPIDIACKFLESYHKENPLIVIELDLLYYFIAARICISLINSAKSRKENPKNEYISVSEKGFWTLIEKWVSINPIQAQNRFKSSCSLDDKHKKELYKVLKQRNRHTPKVLSISYEDPIYMDSAAFQYMYGSDGNTYLDAYNNIPHVGHEHPRVVAAAQVQIAKLNTNTRYIYDPLQEYSEKLLSKFPEHLDQVFFVNSGSAASDLAVRLARHYTQRNQIIVMEHGYHGNTQQGISISHYKYNNVGGSGKVDNIIQAPLPNAYLDGFNNEPETTGARYAHNLMSRIENNNDIAAFIAEPISGCGGQVPLAPNYLKILYPYLKEKGILTISDEVQTGFGRLGNHYWGYEMHGVIPDIIVLGKPIGNGHPMGAVVTTRAIADSFNNGMEFFSSFGGNPVSCVIGSTVLDVIDEEDLQLQAKKSGEHFFKLMNDLKLDFPSIGDVRGCGLFLGIEFIDENSTTYQPNTQLAKFIKNELRHCNILVSTDGPYDNVIKMKPPLCFTESNISFVISQLRSILKCKLKKNTTHK